MSFAKGTTHRGVEDREGRNFLTESPLPGLSYTVLRPGGEHEDSPNQTEWQNGTPWEQWCDEVCQGNLNQSWFQGLEPDLCGNLTSGEHEVNRNAVRVVSWRRLFRIPVKAEGAHGGVQHGKENRGERNLVAKASGTSLTSRITRQRELYRPACVW